MMAANPEGGAVSKGASPAVLARYVVDRVDAFAGGEDVVLDFLTRDAVGQFCRALGITRNWAELSLDEIAPLEAETGVNVVPADEGLTILAVLQDLLRKGILTPTNEDAPAPHLLNDLLPAGRFAKAKTFGDTWELSYALAVELEHGRDRGMNVTMNHPLLTGLVVMAHLAEDRLDYARLRAMEAEDDVLNLQLVGKPKAEVLEALETVTKARAYLEERILERLENV